MAEESLGRAVLELVADLNPLKKDLEEGKFSAEEMAKTTSKGFKGGIQKAALPAAAALGIVALGMHKAVDAAEEDQAAQARLANAFKASKVPMDEYKGKIEEAVQSSAKLGFKSGDVKDALGSLVVATHDGKKAIDLLSTAQDIARFKHVDLATAAKTLTMTMAGSSRAARQLGIQVQAETKYADLARNAHTAQAAALKASFPAYAKMTQAQKDQYYAQKDALDTQYAAAKATATLKDKSATAAETIQVVNDKLHGQADAYAQTAAGAKEKMGAEMQLLEENLGKALLPALTQVSTTLAGLTGFFVQHATIAKVVIGLIAGLAGAVLAVNVAMKLYEVSTKLATAAEWLFNLALEANPIGIVILALLALGAAFLLLRSHLDQVIGWIRSNWPLLLGILTGPFGLAVLEVVRHIGEIKQKIVGAWDDFKSVATTLGDKIKNGVVGGVEGIAGAVWGVVNNIAGLAGQYAGAIAGWGKSIGEGIVHGITGAFGAIGSALVGAVKAAVNGVIREIDSIRLPVGISVKTYHGIPKGISIEWGTPINIPELAAGGIVSSPTLAMIGEAGPEAVVPLDKGAGLGGVHVTVNGWVGSDQDLATKLGRTLENMKSRGTAFAF